MTDPLASVCVFAYNHGPFIGECLDGILAQKTDFPFEVVIGEDGSDDATPEICRRYAAAHPDRIRLFHRTRENLVRVRGRVTGRANLVATVTAARGDYWAWCDGDDYWCDELKLQRQVDFLRTHPDYALCFHPVRVLRGGRFEEDFQDVGPVDSTALDLATRVSYIQSCSAVYRNVYRGDFPDVIYRTLMADFPLALLHARTGRVRKLPQAMAVYRVHDGNTWNNQPAADKHEFLACAVAELLGEFRDEVGVRLMHTLDRLLVTLVCHHLLENRPERAVALLDEVGGITGLDFSHLHPERLKAVPTATAGELARAYPFGSLVKSAFTRGVDKFLRRRRLCR